MAVVDDNQARAVEEVPEALQGKFVGVRGSSEAGVLLWGWHEGESSFWLLDPDTLLIKSVPWQAPSLNLGDQLVEDNEASLLREDLAVCLAGERVLVVEGMPHDDGSALETVLTSVDVATGDVEVERAPLDLEEGVIMNRLLCNDEEAQLISRYRSTLLPVVNEVDVSDGDVEVGPAQVPESIPGYDFAGLNYGSASVAFTYTGDVVETTETLPNESNTRVHLGGQAPVAVDQYTLGHGWQTIERDNVMASDTFYPIAEPEPGLIARSIDISADGTADSTTFRVEH